MKHKLKHIHMFICHSSKNENKKKLIELFYFHEIWIRVGGMNLITFVACYATIRLNSVAGSALYEPKRVQNFCTSRCSEAHDRVRKRQKKNSMMGGRKVVKMFGWLSNQQSTQLNWISAFTSIKCKNHCWLASTCRHFMWAQNIMEFSMWQYQQCWMPICIKYMTGMHWNVIKWDYFRVDWRCFFVGYS